MKRKGEKVPDPKRVLSKVRRIPPSSDAARDEGPRLLPLGEPSKDPSRLEHYLDLADTALGLKRDSKAQ